MKTIALLQRHISYERLIALLFVLLVLFSGLYMYSVAATALAAADHEGLEREYSHVVSRVGDLEFSYISLQKTVTIEKAAELGMQEVEGKIFVSKSGHSSVSLRNE